MNLWLVCRTEPALVWETAVGSLCALVGLETLCGTVPLCVVHQILSCCRHCLGKWSPILRCCRQCLGRLFFCFPVPAAVSWQWSGAAMPCVSPPWVILTSWNPFSTLRTKVLHLCASACDDYSPLNAWVCVWWWLTKVQNIVWPFFLCCTWDVPPVPALAVRCCLEKYVFPSIGSRKMSSPWLHRCWSSRKEPQKSTTCKMAELKQQHLGFGPGME